MTKHTLHLPSLGEGVTKAAVAGLLVAVGDTVALGQPLIEVETDKVTVEVPADMSGVVEAIHFSVGDDIQAGSVFMTLSTGNAPAGDAIATKDSPAPAIPAQKPPEIPPPVEMPSPSALNTQTQPPTENPTLSPATGKTVPASPISRRMARELGIDIADVQGSGLRGRISAQDVKTHVRRLMENPAQSAKTASTFLHPPLPDLSAFGPITRQPQSRIGQVTAANMQRSWSEIPHAWLQEEADITELEAARQRHKAGVAAAGGSLTLTAILVKVLASALAEFPLFNASLDVQTNEIVLRHSIHIGVAMDTERGLLVPVLRDVTRAGAGKSLLQIAQELAALTGKARQNKLGVDDLQGAGFTLSNLGGMGLTSILPVVNWPQSAILGVAAGKQLPHYVNGELRPRLILPLTLGFDHRLINGADGARFLVYVAEMLADPFLLALR